MKKSVVAILVCVLFLLSFGLVMLYSASYPYALRSAQYDHNPLWFLNRQLLWIGIGLIAMLVTAGVDYARWRKLSWLLWLVAFALCAIVLVPGIGQMINGSRRWLRFGPVTLQPSELGKIAVILLLAHYLDRWQRNVQEVSAKKFFLFRQDRSDLGHGFFMPMLIMGVVVSLVVMETDAGTSALIALVALCIMFLGGVRWWLLVPTYLAGGGLFAWFLVFDPVRGKRIRDFYDFWHHIQDTCYQQWEGMLAFGCGGIWGVGLGQSRTKEHYLPYASSDFIAPICGEELGLIGMAALLIAFVVLIAVGVYVSTRARELYGCLLGMGIVSLIGFQALINLAVVTSLMPNKGLPLPFVSYGGSNLCVMLACVGLLLSIARHAGASEPVPASPFARRATAV
ncbi:MAG: putative lipid II flippase FtsW [Verrucomicrobia bacterium]|nr:putative lipid II flippase FtsW [Verrucomicrobiota bacterium]